MKLKGMGMKSFLMGKYMIALDLIKTLNKEGIHDIIVDDYEYEVESIITLNSEVVEWWIESVDLEGLIYTDVIIKTVDCDKQFDYGREYYKKLGETLDAS